jgi:hypothetical protein
VPKPPPAPEPEPEFEVVDEGPTPPPRKALSLDDEDDDRRPRKAIPLDDDRDRPRRAQLADEDEDDEGDRPRRRRRDDGDDAGEDDRPRGRRRGRDDEGDRPRPKRRGRRPSGEGGGPARVGLLLLAISLWCYLGSLGTLVFFLLLLWVGVGLPYGLFALPGLVGLANWVVGLVGIGFCIASPRARGLAVAAACVAGVHLTLTFVVATASGDRAADNVTIFQAAAASGFVSKTARLADRLKSGPPDEKTIREFEESVRGDQERLRSWEKPALRWEVLGTVQPEFDAVVGMLIYESKSFDRRVLPILAGAAELARLILVILLVRVLARAARDGAAEDQAGTGLVVACAGAGACVLVLTVFAVVIHESKFESIRTVFNLGIGAGLLVYLIHAGALLLPAVAAQQAYNSSD